MTPPLCINFFFRARREDRYNAEPRARTTTGYEATASTAATGYETAATTRSLDYIDSNRYNDPREAEIASSVASNAYPRKAVDQYRSEQRFQGRSDEILNPFAGDGFAVAKSRANVDERYSEPMRERNYDRNTTTMPMVILLFSNFMAVVAQISTRVDCFFRGCGRCCFE